MTLRAWKTCQVNGCPTLIREGSRCDKHAKADMRKRNQQEHRLVYKTARWRRLRAMRIAEFPFCEIQSWCVENIGRPQPSTDVHHIMGVIERPDLIFAYENLQAACHECHSQHTAKTQGFAKERN